MNLCFSKSQKPTFKTPWRAIQLLGRDQRRIINSEDLTTSTCCILQPHVRGISWSNNVQHMGITRIFLAETKGHTTTGHHHLLSILGKVLVNVEAKVINLRLRCFAAGDVYCLRGLPMNHQGWGPSPATKRSHGPLQFERRSPARGACWCVDGPCR